LREICSFHAAQIWQGTLCVLFALTGSYADQVGLANDSCPDARLCAAETVSYPVSTSSGFCRASHDHEIGFFPVWETETACPGGGSLLADGSFL
jgi:hypothetical protein